MSKKLEQRLYELANRPYRALTKDDNATAPLSKEVVDRAYAMTCKFTPKSWGGDGEEKNPVFVTAVELIHEQGIIIPPKVGKMSTTGHVERYSQEELHALMNASCLIIAGLEEENGRLFTDENIPMLLQKAMHETYTGKLKVQLRQTQLGPLGR